MTNTIPDYSNLKMNLEGLNRFLKDNDVKVSSENQAKISNIFSECDVKNEKGEDKADGFLTGDERDNFLAKVKQECSKLYQKIMDFVITVEVIEDYKAMKDDTLEKLRHEELLKLDSVEIEIENEKARLERQLQEKKHTEQTPNGSYKGL